MIKFLGFFWFGRKFILLKREVLQKLTTQHYKAWIKGKVEQSRGRRSALH